MAPTSTDEHLYETLPSKDKIGRDMQERRRVEELLLGEWAAMTTGRDHTAAPILLHTIRASCSGTKNGH